MAFAGFWRRALAHLIDLALVLGTLMVVFSLNLLWQGVRWSHINVFWLRTCDELDYMFGLFVAFWVALANGFGALSDYFSQTLRVDPYDSFATLDVYVGDALFILVVVALVKGVAEASVGQATPGKRLVGLQTMDIMGRRLPLGHALGRAALGMACYFVAGIPYLWLMASPRRQAFHDYWSGALVVADRRRGETTYPAWSR